MNKMYYELSGTGEYGGFAVIPDSLLNFCESAWPDAKGEEDSWAKFPEYLHDTRVVIIGNKILSAVMQMAQALGIECIEVPYQTSPRNFAMVVKALEGGEESYDLV